MTPRPFSVRSEADVLALVPYALGFHPEDSLVLVTLDERKHPFHARIDLPDGVDDLREVAEELVYASLRNGAERALVVVYTDDECLGEAAAHVVEQVLDEVGIAMLLALRADGSCWFRLGPGGVRSLQGVPYDIRDHELSSRAVLDGRVTYRDRGELADSLAPVDPVTVEEVESAHDALDPLVARPDVMLEGMWLVEQVGLLVEADIVGPPDEATIARLLRALPHKDLRDLVWCRMSRANAEAHAQLWREVVRRSPEHLVAPVAGLLAFSAWLSGHGALAWCAVDRCLRGDPDYVLGQLVRQALEGAIPPSSWRPMDPATLELFAG